MLRSRALISYNEDGSKIGHNVEWNIRNKIFDARDMYTGQELAWTQVIFHEPVQLTLHDRDGETEWDITVRGTAEEIFHAISLAYEPTLHEFGGTPMFEGMTKLDNGKYDITLGS